MDDLIDMMVTNQSPADISDKIKEILMQKSAENIDIIRPVVANSMFGDEQNGEEEVEIETEYDETSYEDESEDYEEDAE